MTTPAVAPYVPFYATRTPYLTVAEFMAAPTGVDMSNLVPGGTQQANLAALTTLIGSASNYADSLCYQVLAATTDLEAGEYRLWRDGTIRVPVKYTPLIEVSAVSLGLVANGLQPLTDLSGLWLDRKVVRIPVTTGSFRYPTWVAAPAATGSVFATVQYVNGYLNTLLTDPVTAGSSSLILDSPLGAFAGMPLTIYDDANGTTEQVTVAASYTPGSSTIPLTSSTVAAHAAGVAVSALPRAVKQAVICLTAHLIKTRGAESVAFSSLSGGPSAIEKELPGASEEYEQAVDLLHPFRRVW